MSYTEATVQLLSPQGSLVENDATAPYLPFLSELDDARLRDFHRQMVVIRRFDIEAGNLQRQGQLALWIPSLGQEAAQVGSGYAARPQDHIFPAYREHAVGRIRGLDPMRIIEMLRGLSHGGWVPAETGNFHLYTLVIGSQSLHATGYAMGIKFDGASATGDPETDAAVVVYFGDGATSQGDVSEAFVFAASYQTPAVFFLQNNHWAISVPVEPAVPHPALSARRPGSASPRVQIDGNDVLAELRRDARPTSMTPAPARARGSSRRSPTAWARTPRATTRRSTASPRTWSSGASATRSRGSRRSCGRRARARSSSPRSRSRPRMSPPTCAAARSRSACRPPRRSSRTCTASRIRSWTNSAPGSPRTRRRFEGAEA